MASRKDMIRVIKDKYGLDDPAVFSAMLQVPREKFVPKDCQDIAYKDSPVPIGFGQTMSQPYTVAFMTHLLGLKGQEKVLEIGTGSGYQAAILSKLAKKVYSVEILKALAEKAKKNLKELKFDNVLVKAVEAGEIGWPDKAPFDAIVVTAGMEEKSSKKLLNQLKENGIMVAPVGRTYDKVMTKFIKQEGKIKKEKHGIFHFVPFIDR